MEREPWLEASQEAGRVINVDDWAEIRRLHRAGADADQGDCPEARRGP